MAEISEKNIKALYDRGFATGLYLVRNELRKRVNLELGALSEKELLAVVESTLNGKFAELPYDYESELDQINKTVQAQIDGLG